MRKILISKDLNSYKANLHCHSTYSDGKLTVKTLRDEYKKRGYSIIAFSDHHVLENHYKELYTSAKNHLVMEKEEHPHSIIVDTYHFIEAGELDECYDEWLDVSFKALAKNY